MHLYHSRQLEQEFDTGPRIETATWRWWSSKFFLRILLREKRVSISWSTHRATDERIVNATLRLNRKGTPVRVQHNNTGCGFFWRRDQTAKIPSIGWVKKIWNRRFPDFDSAKETIIASNTLMIFLSKGNVISRQGAYLALFNQSTGISVENCWREEKFTNKRRASSFPTLRPSILSALHHFSSDFFKVTIIQEK